MEDSSQKSAASELISKQTENSEAQRTLPTKNRSKSQLYLDLEIPAVPNSNSNNNGEKDPLFLLGYATATLTNPSTPLTILTPLIKATSESVSGNVVDMQVRPEPMSNSTSRRSLPNLLGPIAVGESIPPISRRSTEGDISAALPINKSANVLPEVAGEDQPGPVTRPRSSTISDPKSTTRPPDDQSAFTNNVTPQKSNALLSATATPIMDINIQIIPARMTANQITLLDSQSFQQLQRVHLESISWSGAERWTRAPSVALMIQRFNQTTMWVSECILDANTHQSRLARLSYFIDVAKQCLMINNFNGAKCILTALEYAPVHRLERLWAGLSKNDGVVFADVQQAMSPLNNADSYRRLLKSAGSTTPLIPFLGYHLGDLTYLNEAKKRSLSRGEQEAAHKRVKQMNQMIDELMEIQGHCVYTYEPVTVLQRLLTQEKYILLSKSQLEDRHYARSYQLEPRAQSPSPPQVLSAGFRITVTTASSNSKSTTSTSSGESPSNTPTVGFSAQTSMTLPRSVTDRDKQRGNQHQPSVLPSAEKSSKHAHTFSHTAGRKAAQMTRQTAEPSAASASNHHQLIPMNSLKKSSSKSSLSNLFSGMGKRWGSSVLMESSSTEHSSVIDGSIMPAVSTEIAVDISNVLGLSAQPEEDNDVIPNQCRPSSAAAARQSTDDSVVSSGNETTKKKSLAGFLRTTFRNRSKTVGHPI